MLYAISKENEKIPATSKTVAFCGICKEQMIPKCGKINVHHWAHKSLEHCDDWHEPESEWHYSWKSLVPKRNCEITVEKNGKKHRADIMTENGRVIELQHSPISVDEILRRENFYDKMIWLFDLRGCYNSNRFKIYREDDYYTFCWIHGRKTISYCKKPVYFDLGYGKIFRLKSMYLSPPCRGWGLVQETGFFIDWLHRATNA